MATVTDPLPTIADAAVSTNPYLPIGDAPIAEVFLEADDSIEGRLAALAAILDEPIRSTRQDEAMRTLGAAHYFRASDRPSIDRDRTDFVRWLRDEIRRREHLSPAHPDYERVQVTLPDLRQRLAEREAALVADCISPPDEEQ